MDLHIKQGESQQAHLLAGWMQLTAAVCLRKRLHAGEIAAAPDTYISYLQLLALSFTSVLKGASPGCKKTPECASPYDQADMKTHIVSETWGHCRATKYPLM